MNEQTFKTLIATAEICKAQLSPDALELLADDLDQYTDEHLIAAFKRMRSDGARFVPSEIIKRLPAMWPGAEQAWASFPRDEQQTACVCPEMMLAWDVAMDLDPIAGRMAFKETYNRAVSESLAEGRKPQWSMTLGYDKHGREHPTLEALSKGLISPKQAHAACLEHIPLTDLQLLVENKTTATKLLDDHAQTVASIDQLLLANDSKAEPEEVELHLATMRKVLGMAS